MFCQKHHHLKRDEECSETYEVFLSRKLKAKLNDFVHGSGVDETVVSGLYLALKGAR